MLGDVSVSPFGPPSLKSPQTQSSLGCYKSIIYSSAVAMQNGRKMLQSCRKHTQTHIHLPMGGSRSSSPLNPHWRLTLVWTRRGCLQEAHRPEPDVSLPALPPSLPHSIFCFPHYSRGKALANKDTHTHTKTHISLSESHLGLEPSLYPPHKFAHQLRSRDLEQCRKTCLSKWIWIWRWCSFT